jgi:hypothetical protein
MEWLSCGKYGFHASTRAVEGDVGELVAEARLHPLGGGVD